MASGIIIGKNIGTSLADNNGISTAASATAGAAIAINGSLTVGGVYDNPGWGYKVEAFTSGDSTGATLTLVGKFFESTSVGEYLNTITVALGAATVTSAEYAVRITGASVDTNTVGTLRIGLTSTSLGAPVHLNHGSEYQFVGGGTFGGATVQVKRYDALNNQWTGFGTETGDTAAFVRNYSVPINTVVRAELTTGSTTTAIGITAEVINKQK